MCVRKGCQGPRDEQLAAELPCPPATRGSEGQEALRALPLSVEASAATRDRHRANAEVQGAPTPDQGSTTVLEMFPMSCLSSWLQSLWSPAGTWSPKSPHHDGQSILSCGPMAWGLNLPEPAGPSSTHIHLPQGISRVPPSCRAAMGGAGLPSP